MSCSLCTLLDRIRAHGEPLCIGELAETFVVLGENQGCRGWCVLVLKEHHEHLSALEIGRQARIFAEVALVGAAVRRVTSPVRLNYECLGNRVPHVHWHVIPRHADDPDPTNPVWSWPRERLRGGLSADEIARLVCQLRSALDEPESVEGSTTGQTR